MLTSLVVGTGLSIGVDMPAMFGSLFVNTLLSNVCAIACRIWTPHCEFPKLNWQAQKLLASKNWIS
jgi:hypothetical protein